MVDFVTAAVGIIVLVFVIILMIKPKGSLILKEAPYLHQTEAETSKKAYEKGKAPFSTTDNTFVTEPRMPEEGRAGADSIPAITLPVLLENAAAKRGEKFAMRAERPCPAPEGKKVPRALPMDDWWGLTWAEYRDQVMDTAKAFIALGLEPCASVAIFGFNSPEWIIAEMGAICAGGIVAGIYPSDTPDQVTFKSNHSGAAVAVVEGKKKAQLFLEKKWENEEGADAIVQQGKAMGVKVIGWDDLPAYAESTKEAELKKRIAAQEPGSVCAYIYTSGTTGNPKAVMITHDNIIFEASTVLKMIPKVGGLHDEEERVLSYLPLSHVAGMMVDIICPLVLTASCTGWGCVYFARPYDLKLGSIKDRLVAVKPTLFLGVPRVWEKIAEKMKALGKATTGLKKSIATFAKAQGLGHQQNCQLGGSGEKPALYGIADKVVLSNIKKALGLDQCKFGFTGAAPITTDTLEYFGSLGIQINEVYGMSECTGATTWSVDEAHVWGSCGFTMPGTEVVIMKPAEDTGTGTSEECPIASDLFNPTEEEQGEICFRGRHIMAGYMANPALGEAHVAEIGAKNEEAIDQEGWLHSGDKGCMDARGMVRVTGRYKELIIGAGGENVAPVPVEDNIKRLCPGVSNVMMVGDKRKFNVALVTLKAKGATGELPGGDDLEGEGLCIYDGQTTSTISAAMDDTELITAITNAIIATNKDGKCCPMNASRVQKWTLLPRDFSTSTGELTPTLKTRRKVVEGLYSTAIEAMYAPSNKDAYVKFSA